MSAWRTACLGLGRTALQRREQWKRRTQPQHEERLARKRPRDRRWGTEQGKSRLTHAGTEETDRGGPAAGGDQRGGGAREVHPARPPEHAAPVVGAAAAGGRAGGPLRTDGGRPLGVRGCAAGRPDAAPEGEDRPESSDEALGGGEDPRRASQRNGALRSRNPVPSPALDDVLADQERQRLFRIIEDSGAVGEHHERGRAPESAGRDLAELAPNMRRERRPSARTEVVRSEEAARVPRPVRWRRGVAPGGTAVGAGELRQ